MSAFICNPEHFKALAIFAASRNPFSQSDERVPLRYIKTLCQHLAILGLEEPRGVDLASLYADTLYQENVRSVQARYPGDNTQHQKGVMVTAADLRDARLKLHPLSIIKMCNCLRYQSCETEDWERTAVCDLLNQIREAAISALPGYELAPWAFDLPAASAAA